MTPVREALKSYVKKIRPGRKHLRGPFRKILVIKPSSLGDVIHSLPFLNSLKSCFPKAEIHWVIARGLEDLLEGHPMVSRLIIINKDTWKNLSKTGDTIKEARRLFSDLRHQRYDLVVDLQGLLRSGLIAAATRAPLRVGFSEAREGSRVFYTHKVRGGRNIHAVDRYLKIAATLGCDTSEILFPFPLFKNDFSQVRSIKKEIGNYAVIVPGARWETKQWPAENFGQIAALLPIRSLVIGSEADTPLAEKVVTISKGRAISLAGRTDLRELIEVIRDARVVITNDSGPMHIAAGFKVPVVAIFGPTSPVRTGPYGEGHLIIQSLLDCAPCFKRRCSTVKCLKGILPEEVHAKIESALCR